MVKLVTLEGKEKAEEIFQVLAFTKLQNDECSLLQKHMRHMIKGVYNYMEVKPFWKLALSYDFGAYRHKA